MHRQSNPLIYFIQATPRLLMSVVLGFVISTPFVLQVFKPEITNEVQQMQAAQREAYFKGLPTNPVYRTVQTDQATVNQLKAREASGGTPVVVSNDPQIQAWTRDEANANSQVQYWTAEQNCQLYGGKNNGVTCHPGYGPVAHNDQAEIDYWRGQASMYSSDIASRTSLLESQSGAAQAAAQKTAEAQLPAAENALQAATAQLVAQTKNITSSINGNDGILEQLKALGAVTAHNFTLQMARLLLFLLFLFVDIMPVFMKLLMNLAPAGIYDRILADEEEMEINLAENSRAVRQLTHRQAVQAEATGVRHRNSSLSAALPEMDEKILKSRRRVEEEWLKRREAEQMRDVANGQGIAGIGTVPHADGWHPSWSQGRTGGFHLKGPWNNGSASPNCQRPPQGSWPFAESAPGAWHRWPSGSSGRSRHRAGPGAQGESRWARLRSFGQSLLPRLLRLLGVKLGPVPQPEPHQPEGNGSAATAPSPQFSAPPAEPTGGPARPDPLDGLYPHSAEPTGGPADPDPLNGWYSAEPTGGPARPDPLDGFFPRPAEPVDSRGMAATPDQVAVEPDGEGRTERLPDLGPVPAPDLPGDEPGRTDWEDNA
jgi:Domain of unknown function (DUF4407)